jgi:phage tail protein X
MTDRAAYITVQGDTWDAIAYRLWGEERLFMELVSANPRHLDVVLFPAGVELHVPPAPDRFIKQELPPWM